MASYLAPRLPALVQPGAGLTVINLELIDHKPGRRGLIRYEVSASDGAGSHVVFGKLYADHSQLVRVHRVLHTLSDDLLHAGMPCSVPQPLCLIPELSMLVYKPVNGCFLDEAITSGSGDQTIELTARWLGALHCQPLQLDKKFCLVNELANLAEWAAIVGQTYPGLAAPAQQALDYLKQQAPELPLETQLPIHKDFHYRHVLVGRGVKVIDFDEVRLGDPNFDLAHFCANLALLAYREYGSPEHLRDLEQRFLDVYANSTGWTLTTHRTRFFYFYVYTCLKLARQLCLGFGPSPLPTAEERRGQVDMILGQGTAAIAMARNG
jgi:hypothetical protein